MYNYEYMIFIKFINTLSKKSMVFMYNHVHMHKKHIIQLLILKKYHFSVHVSETLKNR